MGRKPIAYTPEQLYKKQMTLRSQLLFGKFLDTDIITRLINLFDNKNYTTPKIDKYIEDERKAQNLDSTNVKIKSEHYKGSDNDTTLHLQISKNGVDFIHLSMHLIPRTINVDKAGLLHIFKDIYRNLGVTYSQSNKLYALIDVEQPKDKPNSLVFSIDKDYYKTNVSNITNTSRLDIEINEEMNVIIRVLNRLFDEKNTEYYVGDRNKILLINDKNINNKNKNKSVNKVLNNINKHSILVSRKNKGTRTIIGRNTNKPNFTTNHNIFAKARENAKTRKARRHSVRPYSINIKNNTVISEGDIITNIY
jgi:hypothetical protein